MVLLLVYNVESLMQQLHPHLEKHHVEGRLRRLTEATKIDWGLAEALAVGTLLYQGEGQKAKVHDSTKILLF